MSPTTAVLINEYTSRHTYACTRSFFPHIFSSPTLFFIFINTPFAVVEAVSAVCVVCYVYKL